MTETARSAAVLADPQRRDDACQLLREGLRGSPSTDLKALLASAPLDGIDLDRSRDTGLDVEL